MNALQSQVQQQLKKQFAFLDDPSLSGTPTPKQVDNMEKAYGNPKTQRLSDKAREANLEAFNANLTENARQTGQAFMQNTAGRPIEERYEMQKEAQNAFKAQLSHLSEEQQQLALDTFNAETDVLKQADDEAGVIARTGDLLSYIPSTATKFGEQLTGLFSPDGDWRKWFTDATKEVESWRSDESKLRNYINAQNLAQAKANGESGFTQYLANAIDAPLETIGQFAESAIPTIASGVIGTAAAPFTGGASLALPFAVGGVQGAGETRNNIYDHIMAMPETQLAQSPEYQALLAQGLSPAQARNELASSFTEHGGEVLSAGVSSAILNKLGGLSRIGQAGKGVLGSTTGKFVSEAVTEPVDEVFQQFMGNKAIHDIDPTHSLSEGLGEAAAGGLLFGVAGGGLAAADNAFRTENTAEKTEEPVVNPESPKQADQEQPTANPINSQALDEALKPYQDSEEYAEMRADLERDIQDGVIEERAKSNSQYGKLAQAYLNATGQVTAEPQAESNTQEQSEIDDGTDPEMERVLNLRERMTAWRNGKKLGKIGDLLPAMMTFKNEDAKRDFVMQQAFGEVQSIAKKHGIDPTDGNAMRKWLDDYVAKRNEAQTKAKQTREESYRAYDDFLSNEPLTAEAQQAVENPQNVATQDQAEAELQQTAEPQSVEENAELEDNTRFSLNESSDSPFAKAVDDVVNGNTSSQIIDVGTTPNVLKMLGLPDTNVTISGAVLKKVMFGKHNVTPDTLKQLPKQINDPVAVMKSSTQQNGYVVLTELTENVDGVNKPVVAALHLKQTSQGLELINIASVYGRNNSQIQRGLENDLLYWNSKKGANFLDNLTLQLRSPLSETSSVEGTQFVSTFGLQLPAYVDNNSSLSARNVKTETDLSQYQNPQSEQNTNAESNDAEQTHARELLRRALGEHADKIELVRDEQFGENDARRGAEGWYHNGKLYLNLDGITDGNILNKDERLVWVAWHELGHHGVEVQLSQALKNQLYQARKNVVVNGIAKRIFAERQAEAKRENNPSLAISQDVATEEAIVELFAAMETGNWAEIESRYRVHIVQEWRQPQSDLVKRLSHVANFFKRLVARITGRNLDTVSNQEVLNLLATVKQGIAKSSENSTASEARYSLSEESDSDFAKAVDTVAQGGKPSKKYIPMGTTPNVLKMLGLPDTKVLINRDVLNKVMLNKHNVTAETLKQLPQQINDPVAVMKSAPQATQQGYVVLTELVEENALMGNKEPVISALHLKQAKDGVEVVNIASVYGKNLRGMQNMLNHDLLYWHKEKGSQFVESFGLQLPSKIDSETMSQSASDIKTETDLSQYQAENSEVRFSRSQDIQQQIDQLLIRKLEQSDSSPNGLLERKKAALHISDKAWLKELMKDERLHEDLRKNPNFPSEWMSQLDLPANTVSTQSSTNENTPSKEVKPYSDKEYLELAKRYESGDLSVEPRLREMVEQRSRERGYADRNADEIRGWAAPNDNGLTQSERWEAIQNGENVDYNLEDIANGYLNQPKALFFGNAKGLVANNKASSESLSALRKAVQSMAQQIEHSGNVENMPSVTVYRAVPKDVKAQDFRNGDWVSPSREYAISHGENALNGSYRIQKFDVPANQLWWDGNDINEWGYDDGRNLIYKNTKNNRKSNDLVTRDDNGEIIPLSKRFNDRSKDIRFSRKARTNDLDFENATPKRTANSFEEARAAVTELLGEPLVNRESGMIATISKRSLEKLVSGKATKKSSSTHDHLMAVANVDQLFENATQGWVEPHRDDDPNIAGIHRLFAPLNIDGKMKLVKLTIKEMNFNQDNRIYSVETIEVDNGTLGNLEATANQNDQLTSPQSANIRSLIQRIQDFNSRDENSEPLFSRKQTSMEILTDGKVKHETLWGTIKADEFGKIWNEVQRKTDFALTDETRPVLDWIGDLELNQVQANELKSDFELADGVRHSLNSQLMQRFLKPLHKNIVNLAKKHKKDIEWTKKALGIWTSANYSIKKNQELLARDEQAMRDAKQAFDEAKANGTNAEIDKAERAYIRAERQYRYRKHDVELNNWEVDEKGKFIVPRKVGVAGFSIPHAKALMAEVEKHFSAKEVQEATEPLREAVKWNIRKNFEHNRITEEQFNEYMRNLDYVPLTGDPDSLLKDDDDFIGGASSKGVNTSRDKNMKGRVNSEAEDAIDAVYRMLDKTVANAAWQPFKNGIDTVYEQKLAEAKAQGMTEDQAKEHVADTVGIRRQVMQGTTRTNDDVLIRKFGNVYYEYRLPEDVIKAIKGGQRDVDEFKAWQYFPMRYVRKLTGLYAQGVTQFKLPFAPKNMIRDIWEKSALITTRDIYDANGKPLSQKAKNRIGSRTFAALANPAEMARVLRATGRLAKGDTENLDVSNEYQRDLKELIELGGVSNYSTYLARTDKDLVEEIKKLDKPHHRAVEGALHLVAVWNGTFDYASSLSAYRALKEAGVDKKQAADITLNLTNFRKQGWAAKHFKPLYMFLNPTLQGGKNLVQMMKTRRGQIYLASRTVMAMAVWSFLMALDDDDDQGGKRMLANGDLSREILIPTGEKDKYIRIPVGYGAPQMANNLATNLVQLMNNQISVGDAVANIITHNVKSVLPIAPSEISASKDPLAKLADTLTPSLFKSQMQWLMNRSAFGATLKPNSVQREKLLSQQSRQNTAEFWKETAEMMYEQFGVDMHPEFYKHVFDSYRGMMGSLGDFVSASIENPNRALQGKSEVVPIINDYYGVKGENRIASQFYEYKGEAEKLAAEYKYYEEKGRLAEWQTSEKMQIVNWNEKVNKDAEKISRERSKLKKMKLSEEALAQRMRALNEKNDRLQRDAVYYWRKREGLATANPR